MTGVEFYNLIVIDLEDEFEERYLRQRAAQKLIEYFEARITTEYERVVNGNGS